MAGFRYVLPGDEQRRWSVAATDQSAAFPASNLASPEYWTMPYLSRSAARPELIFDFAPGTVTPAGLFLNDCNFSSLDVYRTTDGVSWTLHYAHTVLVDPRVNRGKVLLDANLPTSARWIKLVPGTLLAGEWSYRIGGVLWATTLRTFAEPPRPPLEWELVQDAELTIRRGASPQVAELGTKFLRYPDFGSDTNRRLVGGSLAEWQRLLNIGLARPFLFIEPFGNQYAYYVRRMSAAKVAERLVTFGASMTMEEML